MNIFERLQKLLNANAHYALAQAERPEVMLAELLRDIDSGIRAARAALVQAVALEKRLSDDMTRHTAASNEWEQKTELALTAGQEAVTRAHLSNRCKRNNRSALSNQAMCKHWSAPTTWASSSRRYARAVKIMRDDAQHYWRGNGLRAPNNV